MRAGNLMYHHGAQMYYRSGCQTAVDVVSGQYQASAKSLQGDWMGSSMRAQDLSGRKCHNDKICSVAFQLAPYGWWCAGTRFGRITRSHNCNVGVGIGFCWSESL